jgi:hypothetical protein
MSILSSNSKGAVGALALYGSIKQSDRLQSRNETGPWSSAWEARGSTFPFMCPTGSHQDIVFLEDLRPLVVHKLATSWSAGTRGAWARHDYARSLKYTGGVINEELEETGNEDVFETALGRAPQFIMVARILNMTPYTNKKTGETVQWQVQPLILDHSGTIEHLQALSDSQGRDMKGARIKISRSMSKQSCRVGDSWIPNGYIEDADLEKAIASGELEGLPERMGEIDLEAGYPMYNEEEAKSILRLHRKVVDDHGTGGSGWLTYDTPGMAQVVGVPKGASADPGKAPEALGSGSGSILSADGGGLFGSSSTSSLEGLEDIKDTPEASSDDGLVDPFKA